MKRLLLLSFTLLFGFASRGQEEIMLTGTVRNGRTSVTIRNAEIRVKDFKDYSTQADRSGFYFFMIPKQATKLVVTAEKMQDMEVELTDEAKKLGEFDIFMEPSMEGDIYDMSLDDLMNIEVAVATKKSTNIRETPGIISVITEGQIQSSGARDLIDLIRQYVPGFSFASPLEGVVGIATRGIWSYEGRILVLIDGMETNELKFGTTVFGNCYPLENIERIEIIRGPGSAVYGGYAGMGVINLITKKTENSGGKVSSLSSHTGKTFTHNNLSFASRYVKKDFNLSFSGVYGKGERSSRNFTDFYGNSRSMQNASALDIKDAGVQLAYKGFDFQSRIREYRITTIDLWKDLYLYRPLENKFSDLLMKTSYTFSLGDYFKLKPVAGYKRQIPYQMNVPEQKYLSNKIAEKIYGGITGDFEKGIVNITGGIDYHYETLKQPAYVDTAGGEAPFWNNKGILIYHSFDAYLQSIIRTKIVNITAGGRWDKSGLFGQAFSPRIGLTKAFDWFHLKAAYSRAFRAPGGILPNRTDDPKSLKAEKSTTYEIEAGVKLPFDFYLTANLYDIKLFDLLTYTRLEGSVLGRYKNSGEQESQGIELALKHSSKKVQAEVNFAYYQRKESATDKDFVIPNESKQFLAFSPLRINASVSWQITENIGLTPTYSFFGERWVLNGFDQASHQYLFAKQKPQMLLNLYLNLRDIFAYGLNFGIGINNILGEDFRFHTPYINALHPEMPHASIPGLDRSLVVKISYDFSFSKKK